MFSDLIKLMTTADDLGLGTRPSFYEIEPLLKEFMDVYKELSLLPSDVTKPRLIDALSKNKNALIKGWLKSSTPSDFSMEEISTIVALMDLFDPADEVNPLKDSDQILAIKRAFSITQAVSSEEADSCQDKFLHRTKSELLKEVLKHKDFIKTPAARLLIEATKEIGNTNKRGLQALLRSEDNKQFLTRTYRPVLAIIAQGKMDYLAMVEWMVNAKMLEPARLDFLKSSISSSTAVDTLIERLIPIGSAAAYPGRIERQLIYLRAFLNAIKGNTDIYSDIAPPARARVKADLETFTKKMYALLDLVRNSSYEKGLRDLRLHLIAHFFFPALENKQLPHEKNYHCFSQSGKQLFRIMQHDLITELVASKAGSLAGWALAEITEQDLELASLPGIARMLSGKNSLIHFSHLTLISEKIHSSGDRLLLTSPSLIEAIDELEGKLEQEQLINLFHNIMKSKSLLISNLPIYLQLASLLCGTTVYKDFHEAIAQQQFQTITDKMAEWKDIAHYEKFKPRPLCDVVDDFQRQAEVQFPIDATLLKRITKQYEVIEQLKPSVEIQSTAEIVAKIRSYKLESPVKEIKEECLIDLLACLRELYKRKFKIFPYNLQILNILALFQHAKTMAQIKTGEGKSTIICLLASVKAIRGHCVDIVTSSNELAERDCEKFTEFYKTICPTLTCGHTNYPKCEPEQLRPRLIYSSSENLIFLHLFGMTGSMPDRKKVLNRPYDVCVVDEADSMFVDQALVRPRISGWHISVNCYKIIWDYFQKHQRKCTSPTELKKTLMSHFPTASFSKQLISKWYSSGIEALRLQEKINYVIQKDDSTGNQIVVIVDQQHTGSLMRGRRWENGLHQLIEAKHGVAITSEQSTTASMANADYFHLYSQLYGLTGTLGCKTLRDELHAIYELDSSYDSPSYYPSKKTQAPHQLLNSRKLQHETIVSHVTQQTQLGRPVLIICESIAESEELYSLLENLSSASTVALYNGIQDGSAETILSLAGTRSAVTIATNTAGRGADINTTLRAEECNGLDVVVTFPTINNRVELQAFGRTGRQGKQGTYQYILDEDRLKKQNQRAGNPKSIHTSGPEAIAEWLQLRETIVTQQSKQRVIQAESSALIYRVLELFSELPTLIKSNSINQWSLLHESLCESLSKRDSIDELEAAIAKQMNFFWKHVLLLSEKYKLIEKYPLSTPLHYATSIRDARLVAILLKHAHQFLYIPNYQGHSLIEDGTQHYPPDIKLLYDHAISQRQIAKIPGFYQFIKTVDLSALPLSQQMSRLNDLRQTYSILNSDAFTALFVSSFKNMSKEDLTCFLQKALANQVLTVEHIIVLLQQALILSGTVAYEQFLVTLSQAVSFDAIERQLKTWQEIAHKQRFPDRSLAEIQQQFFYETPDIQEFVNEACLQKAIETCEAVNAIADKMSLPSLPSQELVQALEHHKKSNNTIVLLAIVREFYKRHFAIYPYNLQTVNVLLLLQNKKALAQIKTGEGKSTIIALLSAMVALSGERVSNITTSHDLAIRDAEKFAPFFEQLGLTSGSNVNEYRKPTIYERHIIYGALKDYEFAYLFSLHGTRELVDDGRITNRIAIVDESDSMMLDQMRNGAQISKQDTQYPPAMYQHVWSFYEKREQSMSHDDMIVALQTSLQDCNYQVVTKDVRRWLQSAYKAEQYQRDVDYVILPDSQGEHRVIIMDRATGQALYKQRWQNGEHALVEAKEGLTIESEDSLAASVEHCSFLKLHRGLLGLTGTLGAMHDRAHLHELYEVTTYDSPRQLPSCAKKPTNQVADSGEQKLVWIKESVESATASDRPVLIICETVAQANEVYWELSSINGGEIQLYNGIQQANSEHLLALAGSPRQVTVATNTAGRGADIAPLPEVDAAGGLHVILSYLPSNARVELQAYGRTGRQGRTGTAELIVTRSEIIQRVKTDDERRLSNPELLELFYQQRDQPSADKSTALFLNRQQNILLEAFFVFAYLPNTLKPTLQDDWSITYTKAALLPKVAVDEEQLRQYAENVDQLLFPFIELIWQAVQENADECGVTYVTPLHFAIDTQNVQLLAALLKQSNEDLYVTDVDGVCLIHADKEQFTDEIKQLLEQAIISCQLTPLGIF